MQRDMFYCIQRCSFIAYKDTAFYLKQLKYYCKYSFLSKRCALQVGRWPPCHVLPKKTNTDSRLLLNLKKKRIIGDKIALLYLFYLCSFPNLGGRGTEATVLLLIIKPQPIII